MPLLLAWLYWVIKHLYSLALFLLDAAGVEEFILPFRRTFEYNYGWDIASIMMASFLVAIEASGADRTSCSS